MSRAATAGWALTGFLVPCAAVYLLLRHAWPVQHDLSDIGTGLVRDGLALLAGLVGLLITLALLRTRRR